MIRVFKAFSLVLVLIVSLLVPASLAIASGPGHGKGSVPVSSGANATPGPYDPNNVGQGNNQGDGKAPDNGTVGNADGKNPPGQQPGGKDANKGYECDGNKGVGNNGGNPAHSGCASPTVEPSPTVTPSVKPSKSPKPEPSESVTPKPTKSPEASKSPKPSQSAKPSNSPTAIPSGEPSPKTKVCPDGSFVGTFANTSGQTATLVVAVNGFTVPYGTDADGGPDVDGDLQVPTGTSGEVYLYGAEVGDVVHLYLGLPRDNGSQVGTIGPNCKLDLNVAVGPSAPVVPSPRPTEPHESCPNPFKGAVNRVLCPTPAPPVTPEVPEEPAVGPEVPEEPRVGPVVPAKTVTQSVDTPTATVSELPNTGANEVLLMLYLAMILLGLGVLCYTLPVALTRVQ